MKLYRVRTHGGYIWYGTQADAKTASRERGPWEQADIPTDKEGLLNWLNKNVIVDPLQRAELEALKDVPDEAIDTSDIPEQTDWSGAERGKFARNEQWTLIKVEEFIQNATPAQLASCASNVCWRIKELTGGPKE